MGLTKKQEQWLKWYSVPANRERHKQMSRKWKRDLRALLLERRGNKCEKCGSTIRLELHEPNGNVDKHSSRRLTEMRDGKRPYRVLCHDCHGDTDNWRRGKRKNVIS